MNTLKDATQAKTKVEFDQIVKGNLKELTAAAAALDESHPLNESHTWTGNGRIVQPFLEAVAHDQRFGTYHHATADLFEEMAAAVKAYFEELVIVEGADMPGLEDLIDSEYGQAGNPERRYVEQADGSFIDRDKLAKDAGPLASKVAVLDGFIDGSIRGGE
jgi:hypothetical protein